MNFFIIERLIGQINSTMKFNFFVELWPGWSLFSRPIFVGWSVLLPITIKSSSPFRDAFKPLIPYDYLLRWFHSIACL